MHSPGSAGIPIRVRGGETPVPESPSGAQRPPIRMSTLYRILRGTGSRLARVPLAGPAARVQIGSLLCGPRLGMRWGALNIAIRSQIGRARERSRTVYDAQMAPRTAVGTYTGLRETAISERPGSGRSLSSGFMIGTSMS